MQLIYHLGNSWLQRTTLVTHNRTSPEKHFPHKFLTTCFPARTSANKNNIGGVVRLIAYIHAFIFSIDVQKYLATHRPKYWGNHCFHIPSTPKIIYKPKYMRICCTANCSFWWQWHSLFSMANETSSQPWATTWSTSLKMSNFWRSLLLPTVSFKEFNICLF